MHVAVFPPHSQLQHVMQLLQGQIRGTCSRRQIGGLVPSSVILI